MKERIDKSLSLSPGETGRIIVGRTIIDVRVDPSKASLVLSQRTVDEREAVRTQLLALLPNKAALYINASLSKLAERTLTGFVPDGAEALFLDAERQLRDWLVSARDAGFSNKQTEERLTDFLRQALIGVGGMGLSVREAVGEMIEDVWTEKVKKGPSVK